MSEPVFLQATVGGYEGGRLCSVFATLDEAADSLFVVKVSEKPTATRFKPETRVVTNLANFDSWDQFFTEEHFAAAIAAFNARNNDGRFKFRAECAKVNPSTGLQLLKVTERGREYEIIPTISNEQVAGLLLCWYAETVKAISANMAFGDLIDKLNRGELWTA